ncbi:MAG: hypothetical protein HY895_05550 [Deltaproteobacteria bacterium]|nr:hypothetical protein [Deltaproteobacteria bacterium]
MTTIKSKGLPRDGIESEPPQVSDAEISTQIDAAAAEGAAKLEWACRKLAQKKEELHRNKIVLKRVNRQLVETNNALSVLARNIEQERQEFIQKMTCAIASRVLPAIDEIAQANIPKSCRNQLDVVRAHVNDLIPDSSVSSNVLLALSKGELRVAIMIRNGLKTADIARLLYLSDITIKTHRRNIRKKLGIKNSKINLSSLLKLKLDKSKCFSGR